jgi:hypothetical protein
MTVRPASCWRAVITPGAPMLAGGAPSDRRMLQDGEPANGVVSASVGGASRAGTHNVAHHRPRTHTRSWVSGCPRRAAPPHTTPGPASAPDRAWHAYGQRRMAGAGPAMAVVPIFIAQGMATCGRLLATAAYVPSPLLHLNWRIETGDTSKAGHASGEAHERMLWRPIPSEVRHRGTTRPH